MLLVEISPDRWPAVVGTELHEDFALKPCQVWGLRQVGLRPEDVTPGLRGCILTSFEVSPRKWIPDSHLAWGPFGLTDTLSKTTKLILLDSLLQEVCIKSGLAGRSPGSSLRVSVCHVSSHNPSLFRTNESPLDKIKGCLQPLFPCN